MKLEAIITEACDISTVCGHVRLMPGRYQITPTDTGGAELARMDVENPPWPLRLTPAQWRFLDGTRFIEPVSARGSVTTV
jgi:hypothetical protein